MARSLLTTGAELPPRTRRIHFLYLTHYRVFGTTSAHAENTSRPGNIRPPPRNYLRARGEYRGPKEYRPHHQELPPRTRRILKRVNPHIGFTGTTSAHAENTHGASLTRARARNYLRARGEYAATTPDCHANRELPPRTRRIRLRSPARPAGKGTTSAHAENTVPRRACLDRGWNYLRARGEYLNKFAFDHGPLELPPRTRRIRIHAVQLGDVNGTTSAHAENTRRAAVSNPARGNYLRARGEYTWPRIPS